ncbi:MAG: phosphoglucomutase/phosphomannomutase family protein [bacterium]|nr:phosphoglucomutase/phosphomannomutase family protein [bacterium]
MAKISFGTSGWRAIISEEFTFANVRIVTQAIAQYLQQEQLDTRGVVVGYDTRFLSDKFAKTCAEVFAGNRIPVYLSDRDVPTPAISFEIISRQVAGGVNITASHNPPEYNGIKFSPFTGGPAPVEVTSRIEQIANQLISSGATPHVLPLSEAIEKKLVQEIDIRSRYLTYIREKIDWDSIRKANLKIVVDLLYGTGKGYLDVLLREAGCEIEVLHAERDVYFGGRTPEPSENNLKELKLKVKEMTAHLGLALDGDADRFGIIDSDGTYITPNQVIALLFLHLIDSRKWTGAVVRSIATTHLIDAIAKEKGIQVYETPVGFKYIGELMSQQEIIIGGEESGGLSIYRHVPEKDGIIACLLVAELIAHQKKSLGILLKDIYKKYGSYFVQRIDLRTDNIKKQAILSQLRSNTPTLFAGLRVKEIKTVDGICFVLEDGSWVLIRPSGTEPLLRCYAEAKSEKTLQEIVDSLYKLLR